MTLMTFWKLLGTSKWRLCLEFYRLIPVQLGKDVLSGHFNSRSIYSFGARNYLQWMQSGAMGCNTCNGFWKLLAICR